MIFVLDDFKKEFDLTTVMTQVTAAEIRSIDAKVLDREDFVADAEHFVVPVPKQFLRDRQKFLEKRVRHKSSEDPSAGDVILHRLADDGVNDVLFGILKVVSVSNEMFELLIQRMKKTKIGVPHEFSRVKE